MTMSKELKEKELATPGSIESEIVEILKSNYAPKIIQEKIGNFHENDIASAMKFLNRDERTRLYSLLDKDTLIDVLEFLDDRNDYIKEFNPQKRTAILEGLETNILADYLRSLTKQERQVQLELLNLETRQELNLIASFDEDEIGSRMSTNFINVDKDLTVREAMNEVIEQAAENDNVSTIYVTDENGVYFGAVELKDIILHRDDSSLDSITMTSYPYVYSNEEIEECIERLVDYSEDSIPILDADNTLKGVLIAQDLAGLIDETLGEDYAKFAGLSSEEDLNEPLWSSIKKRFFWLGILLLLGFVVSYIVSLFENVVAQVAIIVSFQSLILEMAGNIGTQSLAITIRVLTDDDLSMKDLIQLVFKEAKVGFYLGVILGSGALVFIFIYLFFYKKEVLLLSASIAGCASVALVASMCLAGFTGTLIPIIFKHFNFDPAVASGPLITTLNDMTAVTIYYGLSWLLLINFLHF